MTYKIKSPSGKTHTIQVTFFDGITWGYVSSVKLSVNYWQPLPPAPSESTPSAPVKPDVKLNLQEVENLLMYADSLHEKYLIQGGYDSEAFFREWRKSIGYTISDLKTNGEVGG